jgi:hypothetical protein
MVTRTRLLPSAALIGITPLIEVIATKIRDSELAQTRTRVNILLPRVLFWTRVVFSFRLEQTGKSPRHSQLKLLDDRDPENNFQLADAARRARDSCGAIARCQMQADVTLDMQAAIQRAFSALAL